MADRTVMEIDSGMGVVTLPESPVPVPTGPSYPASPTRVGP